MTCYVVAVTLATSEYKIQRIGLDDNLAKGLVSSLDFSCPIRYMTDLEESSVSAGYAVGMVKLVC